MSWQRTQPHIHYPFPCRATDLVHGHSHMAVYRVATRQRAVSDEPASSGPCGLNALTAVAPGHSSLCVHGIPSCSMSARDQHIRPGGISKIGVVAVAAGPVGSQITMPHPLRGCPPAMLPAHMRCLDKGGYQCMARTFGKCTMETPTDRHAVMVWVGSLVDALGSDQVCRHHHDRLESAGMT